MIQAVDSGALLKEDFGASKTPQGGGGAKSEFSRVLSRAAGQEPAATAPSRPKETSRGDTDGRMRSRYGEDATDDAREDQIPQGAVSAQANTVNTERTPGSLTEPTLSTFSAQQSGALALEGLTRSPSGDATQGQAATLAEAPAIGVQLGQVAWQLGEHGNTELAIAAQAGVPLPDAAEELGLPTVDPRSELLMEPEVGLTTLGETQGRGEAPALATLLQAAEETATGEAESRFQLDAALSRHRMLQQLAAGQAGTAGAETPVLLAGASQERLQFNALLARNTRTLSGELKTSGDAQALPATPVMAGVPAMATLYQTGIGAPVEQRMVEQVATQARWLISNKQQEVTLKLHPEHLGSMQVKVTQHDGVFRVDMTVDNQMARHLLESNLADLRNRLAADHPGGQFLFNVDVHKGDDSHREFFTSSPQEDRAGSRSAVESISEVLPIHKTWSNRGLSIYA